VGIKKRVTSQDVAERAGVSRTTVSFVLNEVEANISPETRQRVLLAAEDLAYVPNATARALARRKTHTIALVLIREASHIASDAFLPGVMHGLISALRPAGFRLLLEPVASTDEPDIYLNLARSRQIDGIVLSGPRSDDRQLAELVDSGFPVVLLGQLPGTDACFVDVDNRGTARMAVEHLIELGHQRIGCITNAPLMYTGATDRLFGYLDALAAHGLPKDERLVRYGDFDYESGRKAAHALLSELDDPPTAIFAASDVVAIGAISRIQELGYRIPQDVAVVGFDDIPMARYLTPPLTTARLPAAELGRRAGEVLLGCIRGSGLTRHQVLLNTELIVRQSSCSLV
jgi:DNA-binding LacI/PurR family transcriptional regulator